MRNILLASVAFFALTSAALADNNDAFILQVGGGNDTTQTQGDKPSAGPATTGNEAVSVQIRLRQHRDPDPGHRTTRSLDGDALAVQFGADNAATQTRRQVSGSHDPPGRHRQHRHPSKAGRQEQLEALAVRQGIGIGST